MTNSWWHSDHQSLIAAMATPLRLRKISFEWFQPDIYNDYDILRRRSYKPSWLRPQRQQWLTPDGIPFKLHGFLSASHYFHDFLVRLLLKLTFYFLFKIYNFWLILLIIFQTDIAEMKYFLASNAAKSNSFSLEYLINLYKNVQVDFIPGLNIFWIHNDIKLNSLVLIDFYWILLIFVIKHYIN